jgi:hypothetical protein
MRSIVSAMSNGTFSVFEHHHHHGHANAVAMIVYP